MGTQDWSVRLRELGQRVTPARRAVLEVVARSDTHISADEIASEVAKRAPDIHRATVFRTLERLVDLGLVAHVHLPHGATTFHVREPGTRMHLHVRCRGCGRVFDTDPALLDDVASELAASTGFVLAVDHTALSGECAGCIDASGAEPVGAAAAHHGALDRPPRQAMRAELGSIGRRTRSGP